MQIPLKRIKGIAACIFDGGQIKIQFGETLHIERFSPIPIDGSRIVHSFKYPLTIICEQPQNEAEKVVFDEFAGALFSKGYWEMSFYNGKEIQHVAATLTEWHLNSGHGRIWGEFTLNEKPIWLPKLITLPIPSVRDIRTVGR